MLSRLGRGTCLQVGRWGGYLGTLWAPETGLKMVRGADVD